MLLITLWKEQINQFHHLLSACDYSTQWASYSWFRFTIHLCENPSPPRCTVYRMSGASKTVLSVQTRHGKTFCGDSHTVAMMTIARGCFSLGLWIFRMLRKSSEGSVYHKLCVLQRGGCIKLIELTFSHSRHFGSWSSTAVGKDISEGTVQLNVPVSRSLARQDLWNGWPKCTCAPSVTLQFLHFCCEKASEMISDWWPVVQVWKVSIHLLKFWENNSIFWASSSIQEALWRNAISLLRRDRRWKASAVQQFYMIQYLLCSYC